MKRIQFYAAIIIYFAISPIAYSVELELNNWTKEVKNDVPEQKLISYSREFKVGEKTAKSYITQVRNGSEWHWSQSLGLVENDKFKEVAWNIVLGDGPEIQRWYSRNLSKSVSFVVFGTAEKEGYHGAKVGEKYLEMSFPQTNPLPDPLSILWVANGHGIFEPRLELNEDEKVEEKKF